MRWPAPPGPGSPDAGAALTASSRPARASEILPSASCAQAASTRARTARDRAGPQVPAAAPARIAVGVRCRAACSSPNRLPGRFTAVQRPCRVARVVGVAPAWCASLASAACGFPCCAWAAPGSGWHRHEAAAPCCSWSARSWSRNQIPVVDQGLHGGRSADEPRAPGGAGHRPAQPSPALPAPSSGRLASSRLARSCTVGSSTPGSDRRYHESLRWSSSPRLRAPASSALTYSGLPPETRARTALEARSTGPAQFLRHTAGARRRVRAVPGPAGTSSPSRARESSSWMFALRLRERTAAAVHRT